MFLTPEELHQLTGYAPNQRVRIRRWLEKHCIPYTTNRIGDPVVLRSAIESGSAGTSTKPNFDWLSAS